MILRAVFGVDGPTRAASDLGAPMQRLLDCADQPLRVLMLALTLGRTRAAQPVGPRSSRCGAGRRAAPRGDPRARRADPPAPSGDDILSLLLAARDEDGDAADRRRAARRADDAAARRPRDHRDRARLGARAARAHARACSSGCCDERRAGDGRLPRRGGQGVAAAAPGRAGVVRRLQRADDASAAWTCPRASTSRRRSTCIHRRPDVYPEPARVPPRALPRRRRAEHVRVAPVRRRHPPLPRRELRALRDADRAAAVLDSVRLRPASPRTSESVTRRAITFAPSRGGRIGVGPRAASPH